MPYKDPERKRQWEREHREERNARRRKRYIEGPAIPIAPTTSHDPISNEDLQNAQLIVAVIGIGVVLSLCLAIRWALQWVNTRVNSDKDFPR
jgi:hypothetical protein